MEKYLPLGSVVLLKDSNKRVMIYGRQQKAVDTGEEWDYLACLFPEGNLSKDYRYVFNHDQIAAVFFVGFQDIEELTFKKEVLEKGM